MSDASASGSGKGNFSAIWSSAEGLTSLVPRAGRNGGRNGLVVELIEPALRRRDERACATSACVCARVCSACVRVRVRVRVLCVWEGVFVRPAAADAQALVS